MEVSKMSDQELVKTLLERNNWTQTQLAKELGFKVQAHISTVVNGKGNLGSASRRLAELLLQQTEE